MENVAATIRQQLGGSRFEVMTGARDFRTTGDDLTFQIGRFTGVKVCYVKIRLEANDTYTMIFYDAKAKTLKTRETVYSDGLRTAFETETGLALTFITCCTGERND